MLTANLWTHSQQVSRVYRSAHLALVTVLSARPTVTFPATGRHWPLTGNSLYCVVNGGRRHGCKQLVVTQPHPDCGSNPRSLNSKSDAYHCPTMSPNKKKRNKNNAARYRLSRVIDVSRHVGLWGVHSMLSVWRRVWSLLELSQHSMCTE